MDLMAEPPLKWMVKNTLPSRGLGCLYGPSGSGKSFLILDLIAAICSGTSWFGFRCTATAAVYCCLEGSAGLGKRVEAWEAATGRRFPNDFFYLTDDFDLTNPSDVNELVKVIPKGALCAIDTLNRASPGIDENSGGDMSRVLAGAKMIEAASGGFVLLCHHTGKDPRKGLRGHTGPTPSAKTIGVIPKPGH